MAYQPAKIITKHTCTRISSRKNSRPIKTLIADQPLPRYRLGDSAALSQIGQLHTDTDLTMITLEIRPNA
eukprot:scaffold24022_cov168-Amphora_coffeaeformis.AAC.15